MKALGLFTILFLACGTANGQSLRTVQVRGAKGIPAAIEFYCTEKYSRPDCKNDISHLLVTLSHYGLAKLGPWSFVIASAEEWQDTLDRLHLPPQTQAFSALKGKMTVLSQTLLSGKVDRRAELMRLYHAGADQLLELAIAHELGHAFCRETDEAVATAYGELLRAGIFVGCRPRSAPRQLAQTESAITTLSAKRIVEVQAGTVDPDPITRYLKETDIPQ